MKVKTYSDGGARGNPGPSAIGVLVCDARGDILAEHKDVIGEGTNNIAEYCALIAALALARELGAREVESYMDSELVVRQLSGVYRVKSVPIRQLVGEVQKIACGFKKISYHHLPRTHEQIRHVDRLVNEALDEGRA